MRLTIKISQQLFQKYFYRTCSYLPLPPLIFATKISTEILPSIPQNNQSRVTTNKGAEIVSRKEALNCRSQNYQGFLTDIYKETTIARIISRRKIHASRVLKHWSEWQQTWKNDAWKTRTVLQRNAVCEFRRLALFLLIQR